MSIHPCTVSHVIAHNTPQSLSNDAATSLAYPCNACFKAASAFTVRVPDLTRKPHAVIRTAPFVGLNRGAMLSRLIMRMGYFDHSRINVGSSFISRRYGRHCARYISQLSASMSCQSGQYACVTGVVGTHETSMLHAFTKTCAPTAQLRRLSLCRLRSSFTTFAKRNAYLNRCFAAPAYSA